MAVDGVGNLFVGGSSLVLEIPAPNYAVIDSVGAPQFDNPSGLALDANGNLFVADTGNSAVKEIPLNGSGYGPG